MIFRIDAFDKLVSRIRLFATFVVVNSSTVRICMVDQADRNGSTHNGTALYVLGLACQIANRDIEETCLSDSGDNVFHEYSVSSLVCHHQTNLARTTIFWRSYLPAHYLLAEKSETRKNFTNPFASWTTT